MKSLLIIILLSMQTGNFFAKHTKDHIKFYKNFLKWEEKNIADSKIYHEYMDQFISGYKKQYELVEHSDKKFERDILNTYQSALTSIMDHWNFYYYHIPLQSFHESVQHLKDSDEYKKYFKLYERYDKTPTDRNLRTKVEQEQKKIEVLQK